MAMLRLSRITKVQYKEQSQNPTATKTLHQYYTATMELPVSFTKGYPLGL